MGRIQYDMSSEPLDSISDYYHTRVGYIFSGTIAAVAFFLFAYRGYDGWDIMASRAASLCAIGIIIFPTSVRAPADELIYLTHPAASGISNLHFLFAGLFFLILVFFAGVLFPLSYKDTAWQAMSMRMKTRLLVYRSCATIMISSIAIIIIYKFNILGSGDAWSGLDIVFWGESAALLAFGFSWLTKSHIIYADDDH